MRLYEKTASELSEMLKNKECSAVELCNDVLARINETENKIGAYVTVAEESAKNDNLLRVWYDEPATDWQTQSLAIGNGYMGGLVFGGINNDKIHINEKTVWESYTEEDKKKVYDFCEEYRTFLSKCKTERECVKEILKEAEAKGTKWEFKPEYGEDIAKEHEKYITEYFNGPVFITDWPKDIKSFYMKQNPDGKTVAAADLEVPGVGELMGGSQREEDYDKLATRMKELGMNTEDYEWYLNLRKYGGCKHSGFGMGFERLLIYLTGVENIRDVIPFPRTPNNLDF